MSIIGRQEGHRHIVTRFEARRRTARQPQRRLDPLVRARRQFPSPRLLQHPPGCAHFWYWRRLPLRFRNALPSHERLAKIDYKP